MTEKQVFNKIISEKKWFENYCTASYASDIKSKFSVGLLGEKAIERLFKHFGYKIKTETQWEKKKINDTYCQCDSPSIVAHSLGYKYCANCWGCID